MKKVININFQGRVIPIEESAFELLKNYIDSLRRYFANEEGRDEIINDIESRIAELFTERLKNGGSCITDEDTHEIIMKIGRPEDFDTEQAESTSDYNQASGKGNASSYNNTGGFGGTAFQRGKLYRNADDKVLGGVCSGIANYLAIDPVILRVIFVLLFGALFWVYILLWIIVPSKSVATSVTKRLYRNPEGKMVGGVCSGIATYFNMEVWIPRLVFTLPFVTALISGTFNTLLWHEWGWGHGFRFITGSLGSTLFVTYIILWIAVPMANSTAEKLEMKGERIDINSIRDAVKDNLEQFQQRAEQFQQRAQQWSSEAEESARRMAAQASRNAENGFVRVIKFVGKVIVFFFAALFAVLLFAIMIALIFGGVAVFPLKDFVLEGPWQNTMAWTTLLLFLAVPVVATLTWVVRRIMGIRSSRHYLTYIFGGLWLIGLVAAIVFAGSLISNFKAKYGEEESVSIAQPQSGKLFMTIKPSYGEKAYVKRFWNDIDDDNPWIYGAQNDSIVMGNVKIEVARSLDSQFHMYKVLYSRGSSADNAKSWMKRIYFPVEQQNDNVLLPAGITLSKQDKFRNQQVMIVVEVPVGKWIELDKSLDRYEWVTIRNDRHNLSVHSSDFSDWEYNIPYVMTTTGHLESTDTTANRKYKRTWDDEEDFE